MKKKIVVAAVAAIVAVGAAWNVNKATESDVLSDVVLANIEALAQESVGGIPIPCEKAKDKTCCFGCRDVHGNYLTCSALGYKNV